MFTQEVAYSTAYLTFVKSFESFLCRKNDKKLVLTAFTRQGLEELL